MFREILSKLNELLGIVEVKGRELTALIAKNDGVSAQNEKLAGILSAQQTDLHNRESAVSIVEDVVAYKTETVVLRNKVDKDVEAFKKAKEDFDRASEAKTQQIISDEKAIAGEYKALKIEKDKLAAGQKALAEDQAKVKEVMKKMGIK